MRRKKAEKTAILEDWWKAAKMPDLDMSREGMGVNRPHKFEVKARAGWLWVSEDILESSFHSMQGELSIGPLTRRQFYREKGLQVKRLQPDMKGVVWDYSGVFVRLRELRPEDVALWDDA